MRKLYEYICESLLSYTKIPADFLHYAIATINSYTTARNSSKTYTAYLCEH